MKNKKFVSLLFALLFMVQSLHAQDAEDAQVQQNADAGVVNGNEAPATRTDGTSNLPVVEEETDVSDIAGTDPVADMKFSAILVDDFEVPQGWLVSIPLDFGVSKLLYRAGSPSELASENNRMALGVKTRFFRRNYGWMSIDRPYPVFLRGFVKNLSAWIQGANKRFTIAAKIQDIEGNNFRLPGGKMIFQGWKEINFLVTPPIVQENTLSPRKGIAFMGFHLNFEAEDIATTEPYYLYIDYLTANIDLEIDQQDADIISDDW